MEEMPRFSLQRVSETRFAFRMLRVASELRVYIGSIITCQVYDFRVRRAHETCVTRGGGIGLDLEFISALA